MGNRGFTDINSNYSKELVTDLYINLANSLLKMNILITGIHGFVGSNLVAALKAPHTIYGLDIVSPQKHHVIGSIMKRSEAIRWQIAAFVVPPHSQ